jgi:hypothetical protein
MGLNGSLNLMGPHWGIHLQPRRIAVGPYQHHGLVPGFPKRHKEAERRLLRSRLAATLPPSTLLEARPM